MGLLVMDESSPTCNRRFADLGIPQTEEPRRGYRELIVTTPSLSESISGAILYDETRSASKRRGKATEETLRCVFNHPFPAKCHAGGRDPEAQHGASGIDVPKAGERGQGCRRDGEMSPQGGARRRSGNCVPVGRSIGRTGFCPSQCNECPREIAGGVSALRLLARSSSLFWRLGRAKRLASRRRRTRSDIAPAATVPRSRANTARHGADVTPARKPLLSLYLVRHGQTEWSLSGPRTGSTDIPLTAHGEDEARQPLPWLRHVQFGLALTSPRQRARRTCELVGLGRGPKSSRIWQNGITATTKASSPRTFASDDRAGTSFATGALTARCLPRSLAVPIG